MKKREEEGKFTTRAQLKKIPRLGAKTYEQAIGFLRVIDGNEPLDRTDIHPENYGEVKTLLKSLGFKSADLGTEELKKALAKLDIQKTAEELNIGEITLQDIIEALMKTRTRSA